MVTNAMQMESTAGLCEAHRAIFCDHDLAEFLEELQAPARAQHKLLLTWKTGIRRTVHLRIDHRWVLGFTRAAYRGNQPPEAYCKPLGSHIPNQGARLETLLECLAVCRHVRGWVKFGLPSKDMDSYLKIVLQDQGLGLNDTLFKLIDQAVKNGLLEQTIDPRSEERWYRRDQSVPSMQVNLGLT